MSETQEELNEQNYLYRHICRIINETENMIPAGRANRIMKFYHNEGYRKLPKDRPELRKKILQVTDKYSATVPDYEALRELVIQELMTVYTARRFAERKADKILTIPEIKQAMEGCDKCIWKSIGKQFK